jgi:hypothetical protein
VFTITEDSSSIEDQLRSSDLTSFELGAAHAGPHPFDDQVPLEFGDGADDDDDGAAEWAAGVDVLAEGHELDLEMVDSEISALTPAEVQDRHDQNRRECRPTAGFVAKKFRLEVESARFDS